MRVAWFLCAALLAFPVYADPVRFSGTVVPDRIVEIRAARSGLLVTELLVDSGDRVHAGDLLAKLRDDEQRAVLNAAEADLLRAEASVKAAQADILMAESDLRTAVAQARRAEGLGRALSQQETEQRAEDLLRSEAGLAKAQASLAVGEADVVAARSDVQTARLHLDDTMIRAPVAGLVLSRHSEVGANADTLFLLGQGGAIVEANVLAGDMPLIEVGDKALAHVDGHGVEGVVIRIGGSVDPETRMGTVRIALGSTALIGGFADGEIATDDMRLATP